MYDTDKRKLLSALSHGSIFLSAAILSVGVPIGILFITEDPVVKENAKEAINFHLNVWVYGAILLAISFLTFGLLGFILLPLGFLLHWGLSLMAIIHTLSNPEQPYRYPFIFRLL